MRLHGARSLFLLLAVAGPAGAQDSAGGTALQVTPSFADGRWLRPEETIVLHLSQSPLPDSGRLAVLIGDTDWTGLFVDSGTTLTYRPARLPLPSGESQLVVYLVSSSGAWQPLAQWPLRVLTPHGFVKADARPKLDVANKGQVEEGHFPEASKPDRGAFQDFTVNLGAQTAHVRDGLTMTSQINLLGTSHQAETLRFGLLGARAPNLDLADYLAGLESGTWKLSVGHMAVSPQRHLMNKLASRGAAFVLRLGRADLSAVALNGTTIVGWSNPLGLGNRKHQVLLGTAGIDFIKARPGGARLEASFLDGSLLPQTGFNQGQVNDAERSRGLGLRFAGTDKGQRLRLEGGVSQSRFTNPRDPLLERGASLVAVRETTRTAHYLDASYDLLKGVRVSPTLQANLTATVRHERVDPLYRSVAANDTRADLLQNTVELSGGLGQMATKFSYARSHDNLDDIRSILKTLTRVTQLSVVAPLPSFRSDPSRATWLPTLTYGWQRTLQFGAGVPVNGDFFSASQIPDQVSTNQTIRADWAGSRWHAGYGLNQSFQDNRQPERDRSDLGNRVNQASLSATPRPAIDMTLDFSAERAENKELARVTRNRRVAVGATWRVTPRLVATGLVNWTRAAEAAVSENLATDLNLQLAQNFVLPARGKGKPRGQAFVRYTRHRGDLLERVFGLDQSQGRWTLNTGLTLNAF